MNNETLYDQYPLWISVVAVIFSLVLYLLGFAILLGFGLLIALLYVVYCIGIEISVMVRSCVHCYYYGKRCGLGKSVLSSLLFRKGDPEVFIKKEVSWVQLIPDFLVIIIPVVGALILLIQHFSYLILILLVVMVVLFFAGNAVIRGQLVCRYCRQRILGCPAEQMFEVSKNKS